MRKARIIALVIVAAFAAGFLPGLIGRAFTPSAEPVRVPPSAAPEGDTALPVDVDAHTRAAAAATWRTADARHRAELCAGNYPSDAGPFINWAVYAGEINARCATR